MILDNQNNNLKVYEWLSKYINSGELSLVTGYFTIGALAYLSDLNKDLISKYRIILGDIVSQGEITDRPLDLLNEEISIDSALQLKKLSQKAVDFLKLDKVEIKTLEPNFCHAKLSIYKDTFNDPQKNFYISGSSNLTEAGIGLKETNNVELNISNFGSDAQYSELTHWFNDLWKKEQAHSKKTLIDEKGNKTKVNFKEYLIEQISMIFNLYSPKELYYKVLFELFGSELLIESENPDFNRQIGRLENTVIYNSLYEFQKNGVRSLIKMLKKYNGAILADSVGLGKTWSALAVMKFFQLQGYEIILMCPKKLHNNWNKYLKRQNSKFEKDKFEYLIRFHTDMSENLLEKYCDTSDKYFTDDKPKLFVIDESHNFRNDKSLRYKFLIDNILSKNNNIKTLLLSATPINNSLIDIRNQFKILTRGDNQGFKELLDVKNLEYTFRMAQTAFNTWSAKPNPKISEFIQTIKTNNFFRLTDSLTVARTRKLIEGEDFAFSFPKKEKPINHFVSPKNIGNIESFEELYDYFPPKLSAYLPSFYLEFDSYNFDKVQFNSDKLRDLFLVKMMYILLVKRLESSWYSFKLTVDRITYHHQNAYNKIQRYFEVKDKNTFDNEIDEIDFDFESDEYIELYEDFELGKKKIVKLIDIDKAGNLKFFKEDIKEDLDALNRLQLNIEMFNKIIEKEKKISHNHKSNDTKLETLINQIIEKQKSGNNNNNQKVLIFTTYMDTAEYLLEQLSSRGFKNIAMISGQGAKIGNDPIIHKNIEFILERFAPYTKLFKEKEWVGFEKSNNNLSPLEEYNEWQIWLSENDKRNYENLLNPIDILIATDVLSEGQNLQDCDMVINYDIHWNPVRIIQRLGRIDRLGSINKSIWGVNFWPSDNINTYLNLQKRVEQRMAAMTLVGAEVDKNFSDSFKNILDDDSINIKQQNKMIEQMQTTWEDIEVNDETFGFDKLSLEQFRNDLNNELIDKVNYYRSMPNALYTGFKQENNNEGIIAFLGYPKKDFKNKSYKYFELIYIDKEGNEVLSNQKEVLEFLSIHKELCRYVDPRIDNGEKETIESLSNSLNKWFENKIKNVEKDEFGNEKSTMSDAGKDILNKLKQGNKKIIDKIKTEGPIESYYSKDKYDLITWFIVS